MNLVRPFVLFLPVLALVLSSCGAGAPAPEPTATPVQPSAGEPAATLPAPDPTTAPAASLPQGALHLVLAAEGNLAQFAVREQLVGLDLPSDAVGTTVGVSGAIVIQPDGQILAGESRFSVDLTTLRSDSDRRDGYVQRNTLETGTYPEAVFVPTAAAGLPSPLPDSGPVAFQLSGDLTVHGVTRPVTWEVTAEIAGQTLSGTATTNITFTDFGMTLPRVGPVLSVEDLIALQLDFVLTLD